MAYRSEARLCLPASHHKVGQLSDPSNKILLVIKTSPESLARLCIPAPRSEDAVCRSTWSLMSRSRKPYSYNDAPVVSPISNDFKGSIIKRWRLLDSSGGTWVFEVWSLALHGVP